MRVKVDVSLQDFLPGFEVSAADYASIASIIEEKFSAANQRDRRRKGTVYAGYPIIGYGVYRTVFDLKNGYVLKYEVNDCQCTRSEVEIWRSKKYTEYLCPIIASGPDWVVMPKVTNVGKISYDEINRINRKIDFEIGDLHQWNFGKLNCKWVIIDYAS